MTLEHDMKLWEGQLSYAWNEWGKWKVLSLSLEKSSIFLGLWKKKWNFKGRQRKLGSIYYHHKLEIAVYDEFFRLVTDTEHFSNMANVGFAYMWRLGLENLKLYKNLCLRIFLPTMSNWQTCWNFRKFLKPVERGNNNWIWVRRVS